MSTQKLHIAIIPDGNRRWAKAHTLLPWKGHEKSAENFRSLIDFCGARDDVSVLTLWCFSTENWKRSPEEVDHLMKLLATYMRKERQELKEKGIRLAVSGRTDRVPASLIQELKDMENDVPHPARFTLHLAIDYGGRDEVVRAVQKLSGKEVTEESIRAHMDHPELPDMDIIIRTAGEKRTSNFALWQSSYAEWIFVDELFPEFSSEHLGKAIEEFHKRQRRMGA